jgi:hypothetical protein
MIANELITRYPEVEFHLDEEPVRISIPLEKFRRVEMTRLADLLLALPGIGYDGLANDPFVCLTGSVMHVNLELD